MNMETKRLTPDRRDNLVKVDIGNGCYLLLTWAEYVAGIERGKRERRIGCMMRKKPSKLEREVSAELNTALRVSPRRPSKRVDIFEILETSTAKKGGDGK
jgi:hypothetical protein